MEMTTNPFLVSVGRPHSTDQYSIEMDTPAQNGTIAPMTPGIDCGYNLSHQQCLDLLPGYIYPDQFEWFLIFMYFVVFVVGLVGNFLVVFVVWKNKHMKSITNLFIVNLSLGDFMVILFCLPATVLIDVTETWFLGRVLCRLLYYLQSVSVSVSVLTLAVISVERYYAIVHPLYFHSTLSRARLLIALIWVVSLLIMIPEVVVLDVVIFHPDTKLLASCQPVLWSRDAQVVFQIVIIIVLYVIPLIIMAFAYIMIAHCLWSDSIPTESCDKPLTASGRPNSEVRQQVIGRRNVAKMLIAVVITFAVCYLPVHLLNILRYAGSLTQIDATSVYLALISHWLCYFNSAINPVIYNFMSAKFRKEFHNACTCCSKYRERRTCRPPTADRSYYSYRYSNSNVTQSENVMMNTLANAHGHKAADV